MDPLATVLSVPAVVAIVQLLKSFGVAGKFSLLAAVLVAVGLNVCEFQFGASGLYAAIIQGLLLGLAAAGLYDVAKTSGGLK